MSTRLTHSLTIVVPQARIAARYAGGALSRELQDAIDACTKAAGGVTLNRNASGEWFDNKGNKHAEPVREYTWWYDPAGDFNLASWQVVSILLRHGEQAVMTIKTSPEEGSRAHIVY